MVLHLYTLTHKDVPINNKYAIDKFARKKERSMALTNILKSDDQTSLKDEILQSEMF